MVRRVESLNSYLLVWFRNQQIVVFTDLDSQTGAAFQPEVGGQGLMFEIQDDKFTDRETGSIWDLAGRSADHCRAHNCWPSLPEPPSGSPLSLPSRASRCIKQRLNDLSCPIYPCASP